MFKAFEGQPNPQDASKAFREDIVAFKKNLPIVSALCQEAGFPTKISPAESFPPMRFLPAEADEQTANFLPRSPPTKKSQGLGFPGRPLISDDFTPQKQDLDPRPDQRSERPWRARFTQ